MIEARPTFDTFSKLASRGNVIPLYAEVDASMTPAEAYARLRGGKYSYLLESGRYHPKIGRFSFCGGSPWMVFRSSENRIEIENNGNTQVLEGDPLDKLKSVFAPLRWAAPEDPAAAETLSAFSGGAVGFVSYDARRLFERLPCGNPDDIGTPDFYFIFSDTFLVFDHAKKRALAVSTARLKDGEGIEQAYDAALEKLFELAARLERPVHPLPTSKFRGLLSGIESNFSQREYEEIVSRVKEYIAAGDIYQANLSQRLSVKTDIPPFHLYNVLLGINPSPFGGCLEFDGFNVVSSSPERLVLSRDGVVETRPIAGTRPRGRDLREDRSLSAELILNEKERAEHIMLVDLERNDIGRVCRYGTVHVDELMVLEKYSHVIHIVSNVAGRLEEGKDRFDVIRATFPGGTITGVPKVRCMEIIDELENVRRGLYTGSIGYISYNGVIDLNIVIRTFVIKNGIAHIQVGAGIVADSDPEFEYHETMHKAEAALKTLERIDRKKASLQHA
ncbi:MAG: anthranilate synthase component I family protein [bacterium]